MKGGGGGGGGGGTAARGNALRRVGLISPHEAWREKNLPSIFTSQDGLSWHLRVLHCKFQMYEDCRSQGRHELLPCSNFAHERNSYICTRRGILDHGLVPKPFGFRQRTVLRAEEARPGVAT